MKDHADQLGEMFEIWTIEQGLPRMSADDLLRSNRMMLSKNQIMFLEAFKIVWDGLGL